jgi:hypothetical protein
MVHACGKIQREVLEQAETADLPLNQQFPRLATVVFCREYVPGVAIPLLA